MSILAEQIKNAAQDMGYEKCGIIRISDMSGYEEKLNERIERIPEVKPYYKNFYRFAHLEESYPWAKSIVICARQYGKYNVVNTAIYVLNPVQPLLYHSPIL